MPEHRLPLTVGWRWPAHTSVERRVRDRMSAMNMAVEARAALVAVAKIHRTARFRRATNLVDLPIGSLGLYSRRRGERPKITIRSDPFSDPRMTLAHEFGHYIDDYVLGCGFKPASVSAAHNGQGPLSKWFMAAANSDAIGELYSAQVGSDANKVLPNGDTLYEHMDYLLQPTEMFARSYAQYVTVRSSDPKLLEDLAKARAVPYPEQWDDGDFEPVGNAISALLRALRWT